MTADDVERAVRRAWTALDLRCHPRSAGIRSTDPADLFSNTFVATFVHGALDEVSRVSGLSRLCEPAARRLASWLVACEEPAGQWRFFGPGSAIDPDSDCTACAAAIAVDAGLDPAAYVEALARLRYDDGAYAPYGSATGDRYTGPQRPCRRGLRTASGSGDHRFRLATRGHSCFTGRRHRLVASQPPP